VSVIRRSALVPYPAEAMYALVADIPAYPEFLPWCGGTRVLSEGDNEVVASIEIAFHGVHKSFTTRNVMTPTSSIDITLVDGPFSHLEGLWRFEPLGEKASKLSLDLDFGFSSRILSALVGPVFSQIGNNLVNAFRQRAEQLHGPG